MKIKLLLKIIFVCLYCISPSTAGKTQLPSIDPEIMDELKANGITTVILSFNGCNTSSVIHRIKTQTFETRQEKVMSLYTGLKSHSEPLQAKTVELLENFKASQNLSLLQIKPLWICCGMIVQNADINVVKLLLNQKDISKINRDEVFPLHEPVEVSYSTKTKVTQDDDYYLEWGVATVNAPAVWEEGYTGEGVKVCTIDSGVNADHQDLKDNYCDDDYSWFDPYNGTSYPYDDQGHGTHTMGTICGKGGTGVAPGATWISCKGCASKSCKNSALQACGQWTLCPDVGEENCGTAPHVVSNSWGSTGNTNFDDVIEAWSVADMFIIFSAGNTATNAKHCGTITNPADSENVLTVGAISPNSSIAAFSSCGPAPSGGIKPDLSAPGVKIVSCSNKDNAGYMVMSGTSMAAPHVTGVVALIKCQYPDMSHDEVIQTVYDRCVPLSSNSDCGDDPSTAYPDPNNVFGYGRVSATPLENLDTSTPGDEYEY